MTFKSVDLCFIVEFKREINTQIFLCLGIQRWQRLVQIKAGMKAGNTMPVCTDTGPAVCVCCARAFQNTHSKTQGHLNASGSALRIPVQNQLSGESEQIAYDVNKTLQVDDDAHLHSVFHLSFLAATQTHIFSTLCSSGGFKEQTFCIFSWKGGSFATSLHHQPGSVCRCGLIFLHTLSNVMQSGIEKKHPSCYL